MSGKNNVSVSLTLYDHATKNLEQIELSIRRVISAASDYDKVIDRIYKRTWKGGNVVPNIPSIPTMSVPNLPALTGGSVGKSKDINSTDEATVKIERLHKSLHDLSNTTRLMAQTQKTLNAEFSHMPNIDGDMSELKKDLDATFNSLLNVTKQQRIFADTTRKLGTNAVPRSLNTSLDATKTAIDTAFISYRRLQVAMDNGDATVDDLANAYMGLQNAMQHISTTQTKFNSALHRVKLPTEQVKILDDGYDDLNKSIQDAIDSQNKLARSTAHAMFSEQSVNAAVATGKFNEQLKKTEDVAKRSSSAIGGLGSKIKQLIGVYAGFETLKTAVNWSDEITLTEGKLSNLTDDVEGFMSKGYQMSQETRTSYLDNMSQMAKMWQLTGGKTGIFETEEELIHFNELLNKAFTLGGSGPREISASMYQLTQALSSGTLKGDELRSLAENNAYFINTLTESIEELYNEGKSQEEWVNLTANDLKKLGAEGVLTSELITHAMYNASDKIRKEYDNIAPTFAQVGQSMLNQIQRVSTPILKTINKILTNPAFEKTTQSLIKMLTIVLAFIEPILNALLWVGEIIADNWGVVEPILWGIIGAFGAYFTYLQLAKVYTIALGLAQGFQLIMSKGVGLSMVENTTALAIYNGYTVVATTLTKVLGAAKMFLAGATWSAVVAEYSLLAPILLIIGVIVALIAVLYLGVYAYNKLTGSTLSATGIIVGAAYALYAHVYNRFAYLWNFLVSFAEFLVNLFIDPTYAVKRAFGDMAIGVINIWMGINDSMISIVNSIKDTINEFLGYINTAINGVVDAYNSTLGKRFGTWGKVELELTADPWVEQNKMFEDWKTNINSWVGESSKDVVDYDKYKLETKSLSDYYNKGYAKGESFDKSVKDFFDVDKYLNDIPGLDEYKDSIPNYEIPNTAGLSELPDYASDSIDELKGVHDNTDDLVSMGAEDLKYLKEIAEQKVINRFTTAEIKLTNNINNNVNSETDLDGMMDYFTAMLEQACEVTAERTNGVGVV